MISQQIDEKLAEVIELLLSASLDENVKNYLIDQLYKVKQDIGGLLYNEESKEVP